MFIDTKTQIASLPLVIRAPRKTEERLAGTCFRRLDGGGRSGNFFSVKSLPQLLRLENSRVARELVEAANAEIGEGFGTCSVQIDLDEPVGWASTSPIANFGEDELETFKPNRRSDAKRVIAGSSRRAPKTRSLTIVYELRRETREREQIAIVIHSAYPGEDIGELKDDVSAREGVAFFDWDHPGEE